MTKPMTTGSGLTSDEWCTPKWLADALGYFDLDPCGNRRSHIGSGTVFWRPSDGLAEDWSKCGSGESPASVFCNPPYSNVLPWAAKLAAHDGPWCALLKLDPTTRWWAALMSASPQVAPFRKRIKFEGDLPMTANFPSVLVFKRWWPSDELAKHLWIATYRSAA